MGHLWSQSCVDHSMLDHLEYYKYLRRHPWPNWESYLFWLAWHVSRNQQWWKHQSCYWSTDRSCQFRKWNLRWPRLCQSSCGQSDAPQCRWPALGTGREETATQWMALWSHWLMLLASQMVADQSHRSKKDSHTSNAVSSAYIGQWGKGINFSNLLHLL